MKNSHRIILSFLALVLISNTSNSYAQQSRQIQQTQRVQNQVQQRQPYQAPVRQPQSKWKNLGRIDQINLSRLNPLGCEYRLFSVVSSASSVNSTFEYYPFDSVTLNGEENTVQFKKHLVIESAGALFNLVRDEHYAEYSSLIKQQQNNMHISCELIYEPKATEKLTAHCFGSGPEETVPGVDGGYIIMPGGLYESTSYFRTNHFHLQENC